MNAFRLYFITFDSQEGSTRFMIFTFWYCKSDTFCDVKSVILSNCTLNIDIKLLFIKMTPIQINTKQWNNLTAIPLCLKLWTYENFIFKNYFSQVFKTTLHDSHNRLVYSRRIILIKINKCEFVEFFLVFIILFKILFSYFEEIRDVQI